MACFKVGDRVMLDIEGAPCMTVVVVRNNEITCRWFGSDGTLHERAFPPAELLPEVKHIPPPAPMAYHKKTSTTTTAHHPEQEK